MRHRDSLDIPNELLVADTIAVEQSALVEIGHLLGEPGGSVISVKTQSERFEVSIRLVLVSLGFLFREYVFDDCPSCPSAVSRAYPVPSCSPFCFKSDLQSPESEAPLRAPRSLSDPGSLVEASIWVSTLIGMASGQWFAREGVRADMVMRTAYIPKATLSLAGRKRGKGRDDKPRVGRQTEETGEFRGAEPIEPGTISSLVKHAHLSSRDFPCMRHSIAERLI
jgi:hypothetical protein